MMFKKRTQTQEEFIMMRLEDMVPQEHLLRKVERAIDLILSMNSLNLCIPKTKEDTVLNP